MPNIWRLARYLTSGSASLALDVALQWVFLALLAWPVWLASGASYEIALLAHFAGVHWWVFGHRQHSWRRLIEFHATALTAEVITLAVTNGLVYGPTSATFATGIGPYAAKIAGTGAAFAWTFGSSFFWIWRPGRGSQPGPASGSPAGTVAGDERRQLAS
jgi:putative flippase GtrA